MGRTRVVFGPADNAPGPGHDGIALRFRFGVIRQGDGARKSEVDRSFVRVDASRSLLATWGLKDLPDRHPQILGTLFQFAMDEVRSAFEEGRFPKLKDIVLDTYSQPQAYPFDVARLVVSNGHVLEFDDDELHLAAEEAERARRKIGFKPRDEEKAQDADA